MPNRTTFSASCLLMAFASLLQAAEAPAPRVLILTDKSPGSVLFATTWSCNAIDGGAELTVCEDPSKFSEKINSEDWARILVVHNDVAPEAEFVITLRVWSDQHPEGSIQWAIWKVPSSTTVDPTMAIMPTTALVIWRDKRSMIGYATTKPAKPAKPTTHQGLVLPDFNDIELRATPETLGAISNTPQLCPSRASMALTAVLAIATMPSCELDALIAFIERIGGHLTHFSCIIGSPRSGGHGPPSCDMRCAPRAWATGRTEPQA